MSSDCHNTWTGHVLPLDEFNPLQHSSSTFLSFFSRSILSEEIVILFSSQTLHGAFENVHVVSLLPGNMSIQPPFAPAILSSKSLWFIIFENTRIQ
jgi:hypothetical protein